MWGGSVRAGVPDDGAVPKYYLAKIEILALVDTLGEGAAVPSEGELAARFGVARETVRQAWFEVSSRSLSTFSVLGFPAGSSVSPRQVVEQNCLWSSP